MEDNVIDLKEERIRKQVKQIVREYTIYRHLPDEEIDRMVRELLDNEEVIILDFGIKHE